MRKMYGLAAFFVILVWFMQVSARNEVQLVEAVVGHRAALPCNLTTQQKGDKLEVLAWYKDDSATAFYSRDFRVGERGPSSQRYWLSPSDNGDLVYLQIENVTPADAGSYECHVNFESSPTLKTYSKVEIIDPPQLIWVVYANGTRLASATGEANTTCSIGPYYEGDTVQLFCVAFGGTPQPTLSWWKEKRLLKNTSTPISEQRVRSDVMYGALQREDHGRMLTCRASNNKETNPLSIDVIIDMKLSPLLVALRGPSKDLSAAGRVRAGAPLNLQCRVLGAQPPPPVEWRINNSQLTDLAQTIESETSQRLTVSEIQLVLGPEYDESRLTCCALKYSRSETNQYKCSTPLPITVRYKPTVQIVVDHQLQDNNTMQVVMGSDVVMNCSNQANPGVDLIAWYHQDDLIAKYTGDEVTPTLKLPKVAETQAGEYACEATNEEGNAYSEPVILDVIYPAYCEKESITEYGLAENEYLNITCNVKSNPPPVSYRWVIVNDSVNANTMRNASQTSLDSDIPSMLFQRSGGVPYMTVFCWGLNNVSSSGLKHTPCISLITDETPPWPPCDCVAVRTDDGAIAVKCEKGYDGGLPQKFKIAVRTKDNANDQYPVSMINLDPKFTIQEPNEEYELVIKAFNEKGESGEIIIKKADIGDESTAEDMSTKSAVANITALALALCGGVALLALAACGLVLCARERGERAAAPRAACDPPLCAYNTEESNCETYHGSDDGSECNIRRTDSFRKAVSRYPSKNFDVRRTSSFHSARYMQDSAEQEASKFNDSFRHSANCRVHSLQNISRKRDMDVLCDHLVMHLPPEVNYNVPRPMNTFYTMPRKMRHKLAKELSDEASEITQSDGFSLPPPPDEYGSYRAGTRIKDVPMKTTPTYTTVARKNSGKDVAKSPTQPYNSAMNTVGLPTISGAHNSVYSYPDDDHRGQQNTTGILTTFQSHSSAKESGL